MSKRIIGIAQLIVSLLLIGGILCYVFEETSSKRWNFYMGAWFLFPIGLLIAIFLSWILIPRFSQGLKTHILRSICVALFVGSLCGFLSIKNIRTESWPSLDPEPHGGPVR